MGYLRGGSCDEVVGRAQNTRNGSFERIRCDSAVSILCRLFGELIVSCVDATIYLQDALRDWNSCDFIRG